MSIWIWRLALAFFGMVTGVFLGLRYLWNYFASFGSVDIYCTGCIMGSVLALAALTGLGVVWTVSLIMGHHRLKIFLLVLGVLFLWEINPYLPEGASVAQGFRDRYGTRSPDDLRAVATAADAAIKNDAPEASDPPKLEQTDSRMLFRGGNSLNHLKKRFEFLRWMGGANYISENEGVIGIWWGGALEGHWGVLIDLHGRVLRSPNSHFCTLYPVSPDVAFVEDRS